MVSLTDMLTGFCVIAAAEKHAPDRPVSR